MFQPSTYLSLFSIFLLAVYGVKVFFCMCVGSFCFVSGALDWRTGGRKAGASSGSEGGRVLRLLTVKKC